MIQVNGIIFKSVLCKGYRDELVLAFFRGKILMDMQFIMSIWLREKKKRFGALDRAEKVRYT